MSHAFLAACFGHPSRTAREELRSAFPVQNQFYDLLAMCVLQEMVSVLEAIEARGGNPFKEYSLPEAVLKFRQGVGLLIRSGRDHGTVTILDSRVRNQWYGRLFLQSLEKCPVEELEIPGIGNGL